MTNYESFAVGCPMKADVTSNQSYRIYGDINFICELYSEDSAIIIDTNGKSEEIIFTFIEDNCIVDKDNKYHDLKNIVFLAKIS